MRACHVACTLVSMLHVIIHQFFQCFCEQSTIIAPILQMTTWRHRGLTTNKNTRQTKQNRTHFPKGTSCGAGIWSRQQTASPGWCLWLLMSPSMAGKRVCSCQESLSGVGESIIFSGIVCLRKNVVLEINLAQVPMRSPWFCPSGINSRSLNYSETWL